MDKELKQAIKNGELALHYQPKLQISTGRIYGVEALLRWHHPIQGNIPPSQFIPRAEQSTLIDQFRHFPKADHEDGCDATEMCWKIATGFMKASQSDAFDLPEPDMVGGFGGGGFGMGYWN